MKSINLTVVKVKALQTKLEVKGAGRKSLRKPAVKKRKIVGINFYQDSPTGKHKKRYVYQYADTHRQHPGKKFYYKKYKTGKRRIFI